MLNLEGEMCVHVLTCMSTWEVYFSAKDLKYGLNLISLISMPICKDMN